MPDRAAPWDLTALLNAAAPTVDPTAHAQQPLAERHLWLIRAMEWLRHAPVPGEPMTPTPVLRLKHLLNVLERHPEHRDNVALLLQQFWQGVDVAALFADFGFAPRTHFAGELLQRLRLKLLPQTPVTTDLGELFGLLFPHPDDALWLEAIDETTLHRLMALNAAELTHWQAPLLDAIMFLSSSVRASGFSSSLRQRMSAELLVDAPFNQLARVAEAVCDHIRARSASDSDEAELLRNAQYLRALLDTCRQCADSVHEHLEEHGVSINVVFEVDQLRERTHRIEQLLTCVLSTDPSRDMTLLLADLVRTANERRSLRALFSRHYSLLARKVAERSAEKGEHYITRDRAEYAHMLRTAAGGGAVIAGTTLMKFALGALTVSAFWAGFLAGLNYAGSFVLVHVLHWTVATKQPAMTAPAMADKLGNLADDAAVEGFVDEVAHLIRSQVAGILGNLSAVIPIVLAVQWLSRAAFGAPVVGLKDAQHVLDSLTFLGPTALFAAFTGVLLFASSLIAGWVENWFVWNRLDSAIAWNPNIVARLGAARAQRWAAYWRGNISGYASNISLGFLLGLVPAVAAFFGLPLEVRHVTLSTGQLAAAVGAQGWAVFQTSAFWWCVASIPAIAVLNLGVSFFLAFRVALRSRGIRLADRSRIYRAIRRRVWTAPSLFIVPPRS
jgi:site-specific recombinase